MARYATLQRNNLKVIFTEMEQDFDNRAIRQKASEMLEKVKENSEKDYEKNLIYITAGTLVLSITFVEKVTPLPEAIEVWMIITSWALLSASIGLNLISHWLSIRQAETLNKLVIDKDIEESEINKWIDKKNKPINFLNGLTLLTVLFGIIFLVLYCSFNTLNMSNKEKTSTPAKREVKETIEKGRTLSRVSLFPSQNEGGSKPSDTSTSQNTASDKK